jgi:hypothetical protein
MTQCLKLAGRNFKVKWTVVESDRPHLLKWEGRGPLRSKAKVVNTLTATDTGTHFSYSNEYSLPGGPLGNMAGPVVRRVTTGELDSTLQKLKALLE